MEIIPTEFSGLFLVRPRIFQDDRGAFVKTFHGPTFLAAGLKFEPQEEFFSTSHRNVVRGMHFQLPPHTQARLVYCVTGRILDVVVDLRKQSPTFGRVFSRELNAVSREMIFIPEGFGHGFLSLEDGAVTCYVAGRPHSPPHDTGVRWDSIGFSWPVKDPVISERDKKFPVLAEFQSPF